tara:strand:+ start:817 stop:1059 length:243 start_codon:yes stop_codon:yes gene_type:complete
MHALENHTHPVCISKIENHLHEKVLECDFHYFKANQGYLTNNSYQSIVPFLKMVTVDVTYYFLTKFQPLPYQLRGPPAFV